MGLFHHVYISLLCPDRENSQLNVGVLWSQDIACGSMLTSAEMVFIYVVSAHGQGHSSSSVVEPSCAALYDGSAKASPP